MTRTPPSILRKIEEEGGAVPFARFMDLALSDPEAGYYAQADRFLGESGDFTTAPRKAPAFNRALARFLADLADSVPDSSVVIAEVGGGEGDMAAGILDHWTLTRPDLKRRISYRVADLGEGLRRRQLEALTPARDAGWDAAAWSDEDHARKGRAGAGAGAVGFVVTNELLDAFPVHLVDLRGPEPVEAWVRADPAAADATPLAVEWGGLSSEAAAELERVTGGRRGAELRAVSADGFIELRPRVREFLRAWSERFPESVVVTIDYGDWLAAPGDPSPPGVPLPSPGDPSPPGAPVVAPQGGPPAPGTDLHRRSVRGYLRHQITRDLLANVGRQDLTADVDFRALAMHGADLGYDCILYASLASFLRAAGAEAELPMIEGERSYSLEADILSAPLVSLLAEDGVGGLFKVMLQVRESGEE